MNFENADSAIKKLLSDYFDVMHHQDMSVFDNVFHKNCALYSTQTGELSLRPYDVYRDVVADRESPSSLGNARRDKVLMFDQVSATLALVKVQLEMFGGVMQDYLNIVYLDGQWWIMAKMWERVGDAEPA
jgi:3',5'-cyclic AMP phosphodiesterase CpdA